MEWFKVELLDPRSWIAAQVHKQAPESFSEELLQSLLNTYELLESLSSFSDSGGKYSILCFHTGKPQKWVFKSTPYDDACDGSFLSLFLESPNCEGHAL